MELYIYSVLLLIITHATLSSSLILSSSSSYSASSPSLSSGDTIEDEASDIGTTLCYEAHLSDYATCDSKNGIIYLIDPDKKSFDDARTYCRQKFEYHQNADLLAFTSCQDWDRIKKELAIFFQEKQIPKGSSSSWFWTQIVAGPKMRQSGDFETEMRPIHPRPDLKWPTDGERCLNNVRDALEPGKGYALAILANNLSITPRIITSTSPDKEQLGQALCHFHYKPKDTGGITESPSTSTTTVSVTNITEETETASKVSTLVPVTLPSTSKPDPIDRFLDKFDKVAKEKPPLRASDIILRNMTSPDFKLETSEQMTKTLEITELVLSKFDQIAVNQTDKSESKRLKVLFTEQICSIYSTLLETKNEESWADFNETEKPQFAESIINQTQTIGFKVACELENGEQVFIDADSIQMEIYTFNDTNELLRPISFPSGNFSSFPSASIKFPKGVSVEQAKQVSRCFHPSGLGSLIKSITKQMNPPDERINVNSDLVSFSFGDHINDILVEVRMQHKTPLKRGDQVLCSYWDTVHNLWNSSGCFLDTSLSNRLETVCSCNHLTNFAILMDISGREQDNQAKSIITLIFLTASIISLMLTVFFLFTLPSLASRRTTITTNLCICILAVDFLIMFGVERTENVLWCRVISGALLYSLASTFTWTLLEGYFLYQMIIVVFKGAGYFRVRWLYLIGYGLAAVWFGIAVAIIGPEGLYNETSYYCWISSPTNPARIWVFAGPVIFILVFNLLTFIKSINVARLSQLKKKNSVTRATSAEQKTQAQLVRRWFKGWLSLMVLLGLTWILGFLYIHQYFEWISYLFIIFNSLQGVFIFFFEIVTNNKARPAIVKLVSGKFPSSYLTSLSKTSSTNPLSSLSSRNSRPFNSGVTSSEKINGQIINNNMSERKKYTIDTTEIQ